MAKIAKMNSSQSLLASTAKGASYLILLQLVSRMLTFVLHQVVLRYTSAETFGIASVKLELLLSTILFISREGYRCALIRGEPIEGAQRAAQRRDSENKQLVVLDTTPDGMEQKVTNVSYIPTILGLLCTCIACQFYLYTIDDATAALYPFYRASVLLFGIAAMLELLIEPLFIRALNNMTFWLDDHLSALGSTLTKQSLLKHVLTEGDKMLVSALSSDTDQGIYAFVWSSTLAPAVLALYCVYVPVMGINGITEGFVQAVASKRDLARLSYYMVAFSAAFMAAGVIFMYILPLGAFGLVLANMVNLGIRITYSWYYIRRYFVHDKQRLLVRAWWPSAPTILAFGLSWLVTCWSNRVIGHQTLFSKITHIAVGALCFVAVAIVV
ncbi:Rft protein-domain-containing protein [Gongronella butleri]|nr:Rft protein-domain-containing protein [Gongronella butleri]